MASELSTILDHIEKISELDLDDVEPTSHVVEVENVLRADEPRESWPRERILEPAPDPADGGFRVPEPRRVSELGLLTAAQAAEKVRAGEVAGGELWDALPRARRGGRPERLPVGGRRAERRAGDGPLAGVPLAVKDLFCVEGVPSYAGSRDPRGLPPAVHRDQRAQAARRGRARARQDEHGRVRDGLVERELGLRPGPEPVGPRARARRVVRRLGRRRGGGQRAVGDRHRHRRLDPPAGGAAAASSGSSRPTARCRATG